jgi:carboxypeptidase family protein
MTGSKRVAILAVALPLFLSAVSLAGDKKPAAYAVVAGTVFRDPGYALPDVKVVLMQREPKPKKLQESTTNYRGEFLFRVPPVEATYVVRASLKGYMPEQKEAKISGEEHIDVNLVLSPESKSK